jgi:HK97 family phage prohead protease
MTPKYLLRMAIKQVAADGSFEGSLAVYGNVDLGGDIIEPGAFTKTIKERGDQVPMLWQHDSKRPIGMLTLIDDPDALRVKGQLLMELPDAKNAYILIKARIVKGLSIGFDTLKDTVEGAVRHLLEIRLWEGSIVTFPMNEQALITSV